METATLLVEIFVEELPFSGVAKGIGGVLPSFLKILEKYKITADCEFFWTSRRLVLFAHDFPLKQRDECVAVFGPPLSIAFDATNAPTNAALSFFKKLGITRDSALIRQKDGKDCLYFEKNEAGKPSAALLEGAITELLDSLNFGKSMRWGAVEAAFIRPIRNIFVALGDTFVPLPNLEKKYGFTQSREVSPLRIQPKKSIQNAAEYFAFLEESGVVLSQDSRKKRIVEEVAAIEAAQKIKVELEGALLEEIIAITESPRAAYGSFEARFLTLPKEVIITSMKINQKYFATYKNGESSGESCESSEKSRPQKSGESNEFKSGESALNNGFVVVCNAAKNLDSESLKIIVKGNERVLKARLEDALFFYQNDLKNFAQNGIDEHLKGVEFMEDSGSIFDKVGREGAIARVIAAGVACDLEAVLAAINLSKNDLVSEMVGEFGELQGIMGGYYVADSRLKRLISEQYQSAQTSLESAIVAISHKLDSIISIFAAGKIPSGSKDPYSLRRAASGIIRAILAFDIPFNLAQILDSLKNHYPRIEAARILDFFVERLEGTLEVNASIISAALSSKERDFCQLCRQIEALNAIAKSPDKEAFRVLFKRVANILKDAPEKIEGAKIDESRLVQVEERTLCARLSEVKDIANPMERISRLLALRGVLEAFFDNVLINAPDEALKKNRLALVGAVYAEFAKLGDIRIISL